MKTKPYLKILFLIGLLALMFACAQTEQNVSTDIPEEGETPLIETQEPAPVPSNTPKQEPAVEPTITKTESLEPEATTAPTSLNAEGPYIIYRGSSGIWISNPDGSFPKQLSVIETHRTIRYAISPDGTKMALIERTSSGLDLVIVEIPSGKTTTVTRLLDISEAEIMDATNDKAFAMYAILDYPSVAWQPNGNLLAFMGAMNGPSSDLYTYNTATGEITQLTDGPAQGISPVWSPDGEYILHYGVSWEPPFGGAILGANTVRGAWAARVSDGEILTMPDPPSPHSNFLGWKDDSTYIAFDEVEEGGGILMYVDIETGNFEVFTDFIFYGSMVMSPINQSFLFAGFNTVIDGMGGGIFILHPGEQMPVRLTDETAYELKWLAESKIYQAYPIALFTTNGVTRYDPPVYDKSYAPAISRKGYEAWEVIENQQGRVVIRVSGGDWETIMNGFVDELIWDPLNGSTLVMVFDNGEIYSASYPDFEPVKQGDLEGNTSEAFWLP